jgi:hypothetical protein
MTDAPDGLIRKNDANARNADAFEINLLKLAQ